MEFYYQMSVRTLTSLRFSWFDAWRHGPEREESSDHSFQEERDASPYCDRRGGSVTASLYIVIGRIVMLQHFLIYLNLLFRARIQYYLSHVWAFASTPSSGIDALAHHLNMGPV